MVVANSVIPGVVAVLVLFVLVCAVGSDLLRIPNGLLSVGGYVAAGAEGFVLFAFWLYCFSFYVFASSCCSPSWRSAWAR